jgi:hypothetical protein
MAKKDYQFKGTITAIGHPLKWRVTEREDENSRLPFGIEAVAIENFGSWVIPICDIERLNPNTNKDILRADAYLIAAAPDLLKSLVDLNTALDNYWNSTTKPDSLVKAITRQQQKSLQAIQKALTHTAP